MANICTNEVYVQICEIEFHIFKICSRRQKILFPTICSCTACRDIVLPFCHSFLEKVNTHFYFNDYCYTFLSYMNITIFIYEVDRYNTFIHNKCIPHLDIQNK